MAEQKESSVLFSLKELMNLEENRIRDEEAERERRAREEAEARAEAERSARAAEERRLREEEQRRREEEQRRQEEAARIEAIRHAEIEKARAEAEHRSRMEALAAQQSHEAQLAALNSDQTKKRLKLIVGLGATLVIAAGILIAVVWSNDKKERMAREQVLLADQARQAQEFARLKSVVEEASRKEEQLTKSLANAKDEAERVRIASELANAKKETEAARGRASGVAAPRTGGGKPAAASKPCTCPAGDPLCSCL